MSAIAGIIHLDERPVLEDDLKRMMAALRYWGPDSEGIWLRENVGFCYLQRKITPEEEYDRQPYVATESGIVLTASARLDNRTELCDHLRVPHAQRASVPDSVLIARSYEKWGEACPERLLGEFAFALWDGRARRLFCARDHFGKTPLYYFRTSRFLAFATQPKGLFALPCVPRRLDETFLMHWFHGGVSQDPAASFYRDIHRFPAGHSFSLSPLDQKVRLREYWNLEDIPTLSFRSDEEYYERFRELFFEAVRCRLRTNYPVGVMLSGGLDSAAVACVAARVLRAENKKLTAFSFVPLEGYPGPLPPGRIGDESPYVEAVRKQEDNIEVVYDRAEGLSLSSHLDGLFHALECPPPENLWIFSLLEQAQKRSLRAMLTGQMGNLSISFNGAQYFTELFHQGKWVTLWRELGQAYPQGGRTLWRSVLREFLGPVVHRHRRIPFKSPGRKYIQPAFLRRDDVAGVLPIHRPQQSERSAHDFLFRVWNHRRKRIQRERWAVLAAPFGMHATDPTSDKRIVDFCLSVPGHIYKNGGADRLLVRRGLAEFLPPSIRERQDRGLQSCDLFVRMDDQREALDEVLSDCYTSGTVREYLDIEEIRNALSETSVHAGVVGAEKITALMSALMLAQFLRWNGSNP